MPVAERAAPRLGEAFGVNEKHARYAALDAATEPEISIEPLEPAVAVQLIGVMTGAVSLVLCK